MEVIYTGLRQTPEMIVAAAIQEDVDAIGLSSLSGAHMTLFKRVIDLLAAKGAANVLLFGGGIIPDPEVQELQKIGVGRLFGPGTDTREIAKYLEEEVPRRRAAA
jgi:methylmalonyl-CoA mutase C-terminal domain/subunit